MNPQAPSTADVIVAEVKLRSTSFRGAQLLVEGKRDVRFWEERSVNADCKVIECGGKETVLRTVLRLQAGNSRRFVGVVDDDLDAHFTARLKSDNIIYTDRRDLESVIFDSPALERVLRELCNADLVRTFEVKCGLSVREALERRSLAFGKLRFVDRKCSLHVDFKRLSAWRFLDDTCALNEQELQSEFAELANIALSILDNEVKTVPSLPAWELINGHDALDILRCGMSRVFGGSDRNERALFGALNMAYAHEWFSKTIMYQALESWQLTNGCVVHAKVV